FLASCRHAFILISTDMIQLGKLAKYSLVCLKKILSMLGQDLAMGYDIGCNHSKTITNSTLDPMAHSQALQVFVGAFHGYAHNWQCQLQYHPQFITSAGLKVFETNKWIFSKQNLTALLFWHASEYHRHVTLHCFWVRWDEDQQAGLGA
ncbi:hypothetical protein DACRYDRAFT_50173, partial [Dacryopinax primogenitus]